MWIDTTHNRPVVGSGSTWNTKYQLLREIEKSEFVTC